VSAAERLGDDFADAYPEPEDREAYKIGSLGEADWAIRKLAKYRGKQAEIARVGHAEIERIKAWIAREVATFERDAAYFEGLLVGWHAERMAEAEAEAGSWEKVRHKSVRLPGGMVAARQLPPKVEVDEETFLSWATGAGMDGLYRVRFDPDKKAILEAVKADGELPPGVTITDGGVRITVTLGSEADRLSDD